MTNEVLALALLWFIILNMVTYALFRRSDKLIALRQPGVSGELLSTCAVIGGGPAAFVALGRLRNAAKGVIPRAIVGIVAVVQVVVLIVVIIDLLVIDIL